MQVSTHASHAPVVTSPSSRRGEVELDDLLTLDPVRLERMYVEARVPQLSSIRGDLRGRMLAPTILSPKVSAAMRTWAGTRAFPWLGKSFCPLGEDSGRGINRVGSDRFKLFSFNTFVGRSRAGDFDAVQLDYDLPENPFFIRPIKDEIREVRRGLYLGQAYLALPSDTHLILYFGLTSDDAAR
jgi:hypothetical protein